MSWPDLAGGRPAAQLNCGRWEMWELRWETVKAKMQV